MSKPKVENRPLERLNFDSFWSNLVNFHQIFVEISGNGDPLRGKLSIFFYSRTLSETNLRICTPFEKIFRYEKTTPLCSYINTTSNLSCTILFSSQACQIWGQKHNYNVERVFKRCLRINAPSSEIFSELNLLKISNHSQNLNWLLSYCSYQTQESFLSQLLST